MWLLCNRVHYIFQINPCNLCPREHQRYLPEVTQNYIYFYVHSQPLSIGTVELVDDSDSQSENKPVRRSPNEPKETKIKPAVTLCGSLC